MADKSPTKVRMGEITGDEARSLYATNPVILLPMGSHEDQGPHAPMGDYFLAEKIAEMIALRATAEGTTTVVAPVLPFGKGDFFGSMPGGIALSYSTARAVLDDIFANLLRHKLTKLIVINGHGGNVPVINDATRAVLHDKGVLIPAMYLWRIAYGLLPKIVGAEKAKAVSSHGADPLTSLGMHLFPERLRLDLMPAPGEKPKPMHMGLGFQGWGALDFQGAEVTVPLEYDAVSPNGIGTGDPHLCSAETGAALAEQLTAIGAGFCKHFAAQS
ncbi:creatinine amidohydrolase [Humitalea rosea]|uniref:Creatinine amidohydrolase n=1 Tax=Humitalea rosea TaxID=990373 RepID=A0A2W7IY85_9PROT|nr:creatininase family protein [Humitalea rosea]PZW43633.1 creatinine amidohydrolase [Humitalea rosea]